jgi:hypothetical protein
MKKEIKKALIGIMTLCSLIAGGCSANEVAVNKEIPMGRYIEEDLTIEDLNTAEANPLALLKTKEGKLQFYVYDNTFKIYEKDDLGQWHIKQSEWLEAFNKIDMFSIQYVTNDNNGNLYIFYGGKDGEDSRTFVAKIEENELEIIKIDWQDGKLYKIPNSVTVLDDGDMIIADHRGIERYSLTNGDFIRSYEGSPTSFIVMNHKLYQISDEQNSVEVYDIDTGVLDRSIPCENVDSQTKFVVGEDEGFYLVGDFGVKHLNKDGTMWELVVDGNLTSFSMPSYILVQAQVIDNEIFIGFTKNAGGMILKKYTYSKTTPTLPTTEIMAYTLKENATLRQIVAQYQNSHPDIRVTVQVGLEQNSTLTEYDAIKTLNTELMAGKGPDLILLDGLNADTYLEKGILADLSDWTDQNEVLSECLENIVSAYQVGDKLYALPVHFTAPMLWGEEEVIQQVQSIEDLAAYKAEHSKDSLISYKTAEQLIEMFYTASSSDWFDQDGKMDEAQIIDFLEAVKALEKQGQEIDPDSERSITQEGFQNIGLDTEDLIDVAFGYADIQFIRPSTMLDLLGGAATNQQRRGGGFAIIDNEIVEKEEINMQQVEDEFTILANQRGSVFEPRSILSVNGASSKQDIAMDVIKMALSQATQDIDIGDGFPVNRVSFERWIRGESWNQGTGWAISSDREGKEAGMVYIQWGYEAVLTKFMETCKTLKEPIKTDPVLLKIILEESKGYFEESLTVKEAAKAIKEKAEFYLEE